MVTGAAVHAVVCFRKLLFAADTQLPPLLFTLLLSFLLRLGCTPARHFVTKSSLRVRSRWYWSRGPCQSATMKRGSILFYTGRLPLLDSLPVPAIFAIFLEV